MKMMKATMILAALAACGGGGNGGGGNGTVFDTIDARCTALCMSDEASCTDDVTTCEQECQLRVASMQSTCATCLLEHANGGSCSLGAVCCPDAEFPNGPEDCKDECATSTGVNPTDHPICDDLCASDEPSCSDEVASCKAQCEAQIHGVTGLCALCLLDGANGGTCAGGQICCPSPSFPTTTSDCSDVCK